VLLLVTPEPLRLGAEFSRELTHELDLSSAGLAGGTNDPGRIFGEADADAVLGVDALERVFRVLGEIGAAGQ